MSNITEQNPHIKNRFSNYVEQRMFRLLGKDVYLLQCPCCLSSMCDTGVRLNLSCNIGNCAYILCKYEPDFELSGEEVSYIQAETVHGRYRKPDPMFISVVMNDSLSDQWCVWNAGNLITDRRIKGLVGRNHILQIKQADQLLLYALGPIIHNILRGTKDLFHPNSFPVENQSELESFYRSVLNWDNVNSLYCIDIDFITPVTSLEKVLGLLQPLIKDEYIYNICQSFLEVEIFHNPKTKSKIELGILSFDNLLFSYMINDLLLDVICWELTKRFQGIRFSRGYTSVFLSSININKESVKQLISDLGFDCNIYHIKEGDKPLEIWNSRISIHNGKVIMLEERQE